MELRDKIAIVTSGARSGRGMALALAHQGVHVAVADYTRRGREPPVTHFLLSRRSATPLQN
jgi:NAD(P)-dependent dehydrogenase (short-subunit alcohol dehydrogenase family)